MKKLIILSALVISSSVFAKSAPISFNQIILSKDDANIYDINFVVNRDLKVWCTGFGASISMGTFEAAQALDGLANGLYSCDGKFTQVPGETKRNIQIFEIGSCRSVTSAELKADCPVPTPRPTTK